MKEKNERELIERRIIGTLLHASSFDNQIYWLSLTGDSKYFSNSFYRELFDAMSHLNINDRVLVDSVLLAAYMKKHYSDIAKITGEYVTSVHIETDIKLLKTYYSQQNLLKQLNADYTVIRNSFTPIELESAKSKMILTLTSHTVEQESKTVDFQSMETLLQKNLSTQRGNRIDGYSFGISDLDLITNGITTPKMYAIGGLKKAGKSRFVMHLIKQLYSKSIASAFLSLEMPDYEVYKVLKASFAGLDDSKLRSGSLTYLSGEEVSNLNSVMLDSKQLMIECSSGIEIGGILQRIRKYSKLGAKVIFIDYLQRIVHDVRKQAFELENISQRLADASREHGIALFILSQLQNIAEKEIPSISHLKGSGGLAEAADSIFIFDNVFRRTREEKYKSRMDVEITQRYGESGKISIYADLGKCFFNNYTSMIESKTGEDYPF